MNGRREILGVAWAAASIVLVLAIVVIVTLAPRSLPQVVSSLTSEPSPSQLPPVEMPDRAEDAPGDPAPTAGYAGLIDRRWAERVSVATGIPTVAVIAYAGGAVGANSFFAECGIGWNTLAGLGLIESDHGRHAGSAADSTGLITPPIYGVALDGNGVATIPDSDGGSLDGDAVHDRAVGPMQIIPQTWRSWNIDGNGDSIADPQNIHDAALAAGNYLCHASGGMSTEEGWFAGIAAYNAGEAYLRDVAEAAQQYADAAASATN